MTVIAQKKFMKKEIKWALTCDFQQCDILTSLCRLLISLETPNYVRAVA